MTATHGCAGRRGRSWAATALVASGLGLVASEGRPAQGCHISPHRSNTAAAEAATPAAPAPASGNSMQAVREIIKNWDEQLKPHPTAIAPTLTPTPAASATPHPTTSPTVAAQVLPPTPAATVPSVQDWHHAMAPCSPPVPSSTGGASPTAASQTITPPTPLQAPASLMNPPTPAPEPSTILSAVVLAGALAWRGRSARRRG